MKKRYKIAIIEPVGGHGGMHYYDFGLAGGLSKLNSQVYVYTSQETDVPNDTPYVVKKYFRGIWGTSPKLVRAFKFVYCLFLSLKDAKSNSINIIHYHFFHYTALEALCIRFAKIYGFKIVITAHDVESFAGKQDARKARKILTGADKVIAHNEVSRHELITKTSLPDSLISVVPSGNYIESISSLPDKSEARQALGLPSDAKIILFFGQIKKVKGLDILLRALPDVIEEYPDIKLLIAGKVWKDDFSIYKNIIRELNLEESVISHIKFIPDDDVANYYRSADLVVLPYRRIYQSAVLLMAMSYNRPVLTSDIQGMTEVITDGMNGYTFKSEKITELSSKLLELFSDQERLLKISEAGYKTVTTKFDWIMVSKMLLKSYDEISIEEQIDSK